MDALPHENELLGVEVLEKVPKFPDGAVTPPIFSASGIATYLECPRKWAWDKVAHLPRTTHPSAALGTRTHSHTEKWLTTGEAPAFTMCDGTPDPAAEYAEALFEHLPPPMDPGLEVERSFVISSPRTGYLYRGFIDWWHPSWPELIPTVGDHKTTSDINRYAKTPEDLETDPQAILYSLVAILTFRAERVRLQWTYTQTRGRKRTLPVVTEFDAAYVAQAFAALEEVAGEMAGYLDTVAPGEVYEKVPGVLAHCHAYGGCPYRDKCALGGQGSAPVFDFS